MTLFMFFTLLFIFIFAGIPTLMLASLSLYLLFRGGKYLLVNAENVSTNTGQLLDKSSRFVNAQAQH
jgi:hypothetical protein